MSAEKAKVAMVVGGGGAIGRALAREYAAAGYRLALLDHDLRRLAESAEMLASGGHVVRTYPCDITRSDEALHRVSQVIDDFGRLDVLAHSAGLTQIGPARTTALEVYRRVMDVNFFGVIAVTRAALEALIRSQGQIIVLSSVAGFAPLVGRTGYCASKYALHGYFETLRCELAREGVSVLLVCPSFVASDFAARGLDAGGATLNRERSTAGTPIAPETVARQVFRAAARRRRLLVLTWRGKLAWWLSRLVPGWYERAIARQFAVELDR